MSNVAQVEHEGVVVMSSSWFVSVAAVIGMLCLGVSTARACEGEGTSSDRAQKVHVGPGMRRCGPPPEALAACEGLASEAQCSFVGRRDESIQGQCRTVRDGAMACVPEGHARRRQTGEQQ